MFPVSNPKYRQTSVHLADYFNSVALRKAISANRMKSDIFCFEFRGIVIYNSQNYLNVNIKEKW